MTMKTTPSKRRKIDKIPTVKPEPEDTRISDLPEPILHHILSFLPTKDATRTCSLSKTWTAVWNSFPVLDIDQLSFEGALAKKPGQRQSAKSKVEQFCNCVNKYMLPRLQSDNFSSIQKCRIDVYTQGTRHAVPLQDLHGWINHATSNNVRDFTLKYRMYSPILRRRVVLPESLLSYNSLKELDLLCCEFPEYKFSNAGIGFSLKKLRLVHVRADQQTLQSLLTSCRIIEQVEIAQCEGFVSVKLVGLNLNRVDLYLNRNLAQLVALDAPNLQLLSYAGAGFNVKGSIMASENYGNLQELRLHDVTLPGDIIQVIQRKFPVLEKLGMERCSLGQDVQCNRIEALAFYGCERIKELQFLDLITDSNKS